MTKVDLSFFITKCYPPYIQSFLAYFVAPSEDSEVEWIGEVPKHWEVRHFKQFSTMKGRIGWQGLKHSEFIDEGPFLITGMNFKDGKIRWDEVYHITNERYEQAPEIQLKENDILMTKDGTIGKLLYVDKIPAPHKASLNSHLLVFRPIRKSYYPRYLYYQLGASVFQDYVEVAKSGTTFFGISQAAVGRYIGIIPPLTEQKAIAHYLDTKTAHIDRKIDLLTQKATLYGNLKQSLINETVTRGLDKSVPMKDSGIEWIGEIPEHWEVRHFKQFSTMKGRIGWQGLKHSEFIDEGPFLITGMNFKDGKIRWDEVYHITNERYEQAPEIQLKENDILMTKDGTIGKLLYVDKIPAPHKASLNSHLLVFRPIRKSYYPRYLYYQLGASVFQDYVEVAKTGTTFFGISQAAVGRYIGVIPPLPEQKAIADYLDTKTAQIDQIIQTINTQIEKLKELRKTLINDVVTGKIKVV